MQNCYRRRRATLHGAINRNDIRDGASARVALTKDSAASATITNGNDELWVRYRVERPLERLFHVD